MAIPTVHGKLGKSKRGEEGVKPHIYIPGIVVGCNAITTAVGCNAITYEYCVDLDLARYHAL